MASKTEQDPFDTATSEFVGLKDLAGRLVLVIPKELQRGIPSTRPGAGKKTYDRVVADVIVLDGPADPDKGIDEIPYTFEDMFVSGSAVVPQLRSAVKKRRPKLGVVVLQKPQVKGNNPAPILEGEDVTEEQKALARAAYATWQAEQEDPFDTQGKDEED